MEPINYFLIFIKYHQIAGRKQNLLAKIPTLDKYGLDAKGNMIQGPTTLKPSKNTRKRMKTQDSINNQTIRRIRESVVTSVNDDGMAIPSTSSPSAIHHDSSIGSRNQQLPQEKSILQESIDSPDQHFRQEKNGTNMFDETNQSNKSNE